MKWHIVGADGYVGAQLREHLPQGTEVELYVQNKNATEQHKIELTDLQNQTFESIEEGDFVVFLAAISSPDICENQYEMAYRVNVVGTENFIARCIEKKARVLFFSSDVVNGATTPFAVDENYEGKPVGRYGEMKRAIEIAFFGNPFFKVFRLSYVYSKNDKFSKYLDMCRQEGKVAEVFDALYRNVIYIEDIFDAIFCLEKTFMSWDNTIFNLSGAQLLSRKDLAALYVKNIAPGMKFSPTIPPDSFFAARPNIIATKSLYLDKLLQKSLLPIGQAMKKEYQLI